MKQLIHIQDLSTGYKQGHKLRKVSQGLNLSAYAGEFIALMGPNGSGKSTLMQSLAGLLPPLGGSISLDGCNLSSISNAERAKLISLVLTEKMDYGNLSVWDIVCTGRYPYVGLRGKLQAEDIDIINHSLRVCRLEGMTKRYYSELSDGEKQRVMIARALIQTTPIMLLDEPTAHLDLPSRLQVLTMLRNLARSMAKCILVSTHELDLALRWADAIWLLDEKGRVTIGTPEELVLSGAIERVFGNDELNFDPTTAEFHYKQSAHLPIQIQATGLPYLWCKRALTRLGYTILTPEEEQSVEQQVISTPQPIDHTSTKSHLIPPLVVEDKGMWYVHFGEAIHPYPSLSALLKGLRILYPY